MKRIAILGSTGSIGRQALDVIDRYPDKFKILALSSNSNIQLLLEQCRKFKPKYAAITSTIPDKNLYKQFKQLGTELLFGPDGLNFIASVPEADMVITATVGISGLLPTISAIMSGKNIALANKETLVVAGEIVMNLAKSRNIQILPVDSEHSAIFQCLIGEPKNSIEKIYLTASGGPFRGKKLSDLKSVTLKQALNHPNWNMGNKITIDSATMMNKGLEAIEARWLFDLKPEQIEILIHPQSVIHSLVQFKDGSVKAQLGVPDMRLPIMYALTYPERLESSLPRLNLIQYGQLTFESPDYETFLALKLALQALKTGGNMPCILNAANEIAVQAFLEQRISFIEIPQIVESLMNQIDFEPYPSLDDLLQCDNLTRQKTKEFINKLH